MRALYTLLLHLLAPLVVLRLLWRSRRLPGYRQRIGERFGGVARVGQPVAVWVHAVSVGEVQAALPLIRGLVARYGERRVLVTTTTPTGSACVRTSLGEAVLHSYAPYDLHWVLTRFLARTRPERVVVMETELWPNLFRALRRRRIPLLLANARLSARSLRGYRRLRSLARSTLADCSLIAAQSAADAARFVALGAPAARVEVSGNMKFDQPVPAAQVAAGRALRLRLGRSRPVWVAASTHEGEEVAALDVHRTLLQRWPDALLVLVPRHPQRFDEVARLVAASGLRGVRRSDGYEALTPQVQVLVGDSLGEMFVYLALADLSFVGGSLVPVGGHNVLEPAAVGVPVLFGPHMHNFAAARTLLLAADAAREVSAASLAATLAELLQHPDRCAAMAAAGRAAVEANRGASARLVAAVEALPAASGDDDRRPSPGTPQAVGRVDAQGQPDAAEAKGLCVRERLAEQQHAAGELQCRCEVLQDADHRQRNPSCADREQDQRQRRHQAAGDQQHVDAKLAVAEAAAAADLAPEQKGGSRQEQQPALDRQTLYRRNHRQLADQAVAAERQGQR